MEPKLAEKITLSNLYVHNREASIYDSVHPEIFGTFEQNKIKRDLALIASTMPDSRGSVVRVLDLGCGTGNLTLKFLAFGYFVKAVDISPEMIRILRSKLNSELADRAELVVADAATITGNKETYGKWDIVSVSSVLHHLPDYESVLEDALRQLRRGGVLYVCHEPLRNNSTRSWIDIIFNCIEVPYIYCRKLLPYIMRTVQEGVVFKRLDYSWSDYHARVGLDADKLIQQLESLGAQTMLYESYRSHYSDILARLDNRFQLSCNSHFRFITRR